jgi:membrane-bound metal-dependent hydrolase YbcI (DUF457 family)
MPITPFHFGPGAALHAVAPRFVSFLAFCAANVLIDIEPLYYLLTRQYPLHRFFHTYIGAAIVAASTAAILAVSIRVARALRLPNTFDWHDLGMRAVAVGAIAGTFSHVLLDSVMHPDIKPFAPFSDSNPLLGVVPLQALHWSCVGSGIAGIAVLLARSHWRQPS